MNDATTYNAMVAAITEGYRLFDTAQVYNNEAMVGKALRDSGLPREDYFVVTKLSSQCHGYESAKSNLRQSLDRLGLDYVDLYLIHSHRGGSNVETWKAFTELKAAGLTRSIGVSNFNVQHIQPLIDAGLEVPAVDQFELHPWNQHKDTVSYCRELKIAPMGYCPLARCRKFEDGKYPVVDQVAKKYNKTKAQVVLRWAVQSGFITIPKSEKPERIHENAELFDWFISEEEMTQINDLDERSNISKADLAMGEKWSD